MLSCFWLSVCAVSPYVSSNNPSSGGSWCIPQFSAQVSLPLRQRSYCPFHSHKCGVLSDHSPESRFLVVACFTCPFLSFLAPVSPSSSPPAPTMTPILPTYHSFRDSFSDFNDKVCSFVSPFHPPMVPCPASDGTPHSVRVFCEGLSLLFAHLVSISTSHSVVPCVYSSTNL